MAAWFMPCVQALTIVNKSTLPGVVTQITIHMYDGLEETTAIKQTHIPIGPQESVDLSKTSPALSSLIGLTLTFNNTEYYFKATSPESKGYIIIENETTIQTSPEIKRINQELQIPSKEEKAARFGPRLL